MHQAAAGLLQGQRDRAATKAFAQCAEPVVEGFGRVDEGEPLGSGLTGHEQADIMFLVGPIQADEGGVFDGLHGTDSFRGLGTRWPWRGEGIIVETLGASRSGVFVERAKAHRTRAKRWL